MSTVRTSKHRQIVDESFVQPSRLAFRIEDGAERANPIVRPINLKTLKGDEVLEAISGSGAVDLSLAYDLTIPKLKVYRFTYHYHWDRNPECIGFYDKKLDVNMPMIGYSGNDGSPTYTFDIEAEPEQDKTYVIHAHQKQGPLGGIIWTQVKVSPLTENTLACGPQDQSIRVGWISWGVLN